MHSLFAITMLMAESSPVKKVLVVYFSATGNTRAAAKKIQEKLNGDIYEIKLVEDYPGIRDTSVAKDDLAKGKLPKIETNFPKLDSYDVVFVGSPVWWGKVSLPVKAYLKSTDFLNKKVIPFATHGGGGAGDFFDDFEKSVKNAKTVLKSVALYHRDLSDIDKWLNDNKENL